MCGPREPGAHHAPSAPARRRTPRCGASPHGTAQVMVAMSLNARKIRNPMIGEPEDRVVPALRVIRPPEAADAVGDRHDRQHPDDDTDDRSDTACDPDGGQHEREHDVHQRAPAGADEQRLLERRPGLGGGRGLALGEAQHAAHEAIGATTVDARRGDAVAVGGCRRGIDRRWCSWPSGTVRRRDRLRQLRPGSRRGRRRPPW